MFFLNNLNIFFKYLVLHEIIRTIFQFQMSKIKSQIRYLVNFCKGPIPLTENYDFIKNFWID